MRSLKRKQESPDLDLPARNKTMAKEFAESFYKSKTWQRTREAYLRSVGGLCEECLKRGIYTPGVIVHHKIHLTPESIQHPEIALNFDNLKLLCRYHHAAAHGIQKRYEVDELGRVTFPFWAE